jgi:integrase
VAQIIYRVSGTANKKRVTKTFRDTDDGRAAARAFAKGLRDAKTVYDIRTRVDGRVVTRTLPTIKEAKAHAALTEADKLRGAAVDPKRGRVTVKDFGVGWLEQRTDLADTTAALYRYLFDSHIVPVLGSIAVGSLTHTRIRSWHAGIAKDHPTTAAKAYRLLAGMMKSAVADKVITVTPCAVKGAAEESASERPVASVAEVQALADAMPQELRLAVLLAAWCQLRRGEVLGLRREDIDLVHHEVRVEWTRTTTMGRVEVKKRPKTEAGKRKLSIPRNVAGDLTDHLDRFVGAAPDAWIFDVGAGELRRAWDRARRATGQTIHFHDLRHSGLTWSAATGATQAELMYRAGHKSPVAAMRYQHATKDRDRALADALAELAPVASITPIRSVGE